MKSRNINRVAVFSKGVLVIAIVSGFLLAGCATQQQARTAGESGFLDDYSILSPGPEGGALRTYINPDAKWAGYSKLILEPVEFYERADKADRKTPQEDI